MRTTYLRWFVTSRLVAWAIWFLVVVSAMRLGMTLVDFESLQQWSAWILCLRYLALIAFLIKARPAIKRMLDGGSAREKRSDAIWLNVTTVLLVLTLLPMFAS
jgi:hypothetical protein